MKSTETEPETETVLLTFISQHVRVKTQEVRAEVDPALVWYSSSPVAA